MLRTVVSRGAARSIRASSSPFVLFRRGYATAEDRDLIVIGGGVAGYVAAIKAGQAGLKVNEIDSVGKVPVTDKI
jgi:NADPH-dependent 2,4-dienoyl-CoA reductase/sulfur reductase-like enzyme